MRPTAPIVFALPVSLSRRIALIAVAVFFTGVGVSHFTNPDYFVRIMPPYLPAHLELVYLSGVFEIVGGLAVLPVATRRAAGWGLIALLVAVYPANVHMAMNPELFPEVPPTALYIRLPMQFVMGFLVWWATSEKAVS